MPWYLGLQLLQQLSEPILQYLQGRVSESIERDVKLILCKSLTLTYIKCVALTVVCWDVDVFEIYRAPSLIYIIHINTHTHTLQLNPLVKTCKCSAASMHIT